MGINKVCEMNGIPIYEDETMDVDKVLVGRKTDRKDAQYIVVHPKMGEELMSLTKQKDRASKLKELMK